MEQEKNEIQQDEIATDGVIYMGDAIKATRIDEGLKLAGYLVRFTNEDEPDLTGDFFQSDTDFDIDEYPTTKSTYFNHGMDDHFKRRKLGRATLTKDEFGIWAETILTERDEYEQFIGKLAEEGKLGWSSGTAGHLMERKTLENGSKKITNWAIVEASLTHTPAEFRNSVRPIKSLIVESPEVSGDDTVTEAKDKLEQVKTAEPEIIQSLENIEKGTATMEELDIQKLVENTAKAVAEEMYKREPAKPTESVVVTKDESDQPFETQGEFLKAVKNAALYPSQRDKRLDSLKATGLNETTPADGGYLVPKQTAGGIVQRMYNTGNILSRISKDAVSSNNMTYNVVDESSRASTRHGGVLGYWLAEAATKTSSKPAFRQVDLKLKKVAAVAYATDELLSDTNALESWINREVPNELRFMAEDAIINGDGVGKPLGIMNSPCLISPTRTDLLKVTVADVLAMWERRWAGNSDYVWLINQNVFTQILQLNNTYQNLFMPQGYAGAPVNTLLGKPIIETEYNATLGTTGDIILASLSQYQAIDKAIESASSIHVAFLADESVFRFVYRIDGSPLWSSALTPFKGTTQSPFVALATATS